MLKWLKQSNLQLPSQRIAQDVELDRAFLGSRLKPQPDTSLGLFQLPKVAPRLVCLDSLSCLVEAPQLGSSTAPHQIGIPILTTEAGPGLEVPWPEGQEPRRVPQGTGYPSC